MHWLWYTVLVGVPFALWQYGFHTGGGPFFLVMFIVNVVMVPLGYPLAVFIDRVINRKSLNEHRNAQLEKLRHAVVLHQAALLSGLARAKVFNEFGGLKSDNTGRVVREFYTAAAIDEQSLPYQVGFHLVLEQVERLRCERRDAGFDAENLPTDGVAFEHWVADGLRSFGWQARVTQGSGDQGLDVIATRDSSILGIQCKLYARPVGNKAVQEAHAGKVFHNTGMAAVLSNAGFTKSAQALAATTGILLLSPHDIPTLHERLAPADLDEAS